MTIFDDIAGRVAEVSQKTIFFVCGSMKSGTTWLQIMLDAHPAISCRGEGHFTDRLTPMVQNTVNDYNRYLQWKNAQEIGPCVGYPGFDDGDLAYLVRSAILLLFAQQAGNRAVAAVGEKTPDTINGLPLLAIMFPEAKFIHVVRDGRDCAVSGWFHNQRVSRSWLEQTHPSLDAYATVTAAEWARGQQAAVTFAQQRPERCLSLRYEDMTSDAGRTLRRVLDFLGIANDDAIIAECCHKGSFHTLTNGRWPGQESRESFFRKGLPGDWRNHLSARANAAFIREAGPWLAHFDYLGS